jgi:SAM-dependent methyltransferase
MTERQPVLSLAEIWQRYDRVEQRLSAPLSERMLDLAGVGPGMRVLDLATGRGEPAIPAAHRVGPGGRVLGVDLSGDMLRMARERADREGLSNLDLREVDLEQPEGLPEAHFQVILARWCLMYLRSPVAALAAARRALAPGGVLVAAVWTEPELASYYTLPRRVLGALAPVPPIDPGAPGAFYYADTDRLRRDLAAAGFSLDRVEDHQVAVMEDESAAEVVAWTRALGLTRLLNGLPAAIQQRWEEQLTAELEARREGGVIRLGGVTRVVVASPV